MINVLAGKKGTGKTKVLIEMANKWSGETKGDIIYIDDGNRHMYDLNPSIRLMNVSEFRIKRADALIGFISGVIAGNFDIEKIYIDGLLKIVPMDSDEMKGFFEGLEYLSHNFKVKFTVSINKDMEEIPQYVRKYTVE